MERIEYEVIRSARKTIAVQVNIDKSVLVRAPKRCSKAAIEVFVEEHKEWIIRKKKEMERRAAEREEKRKNMPRWREEDYRSCRLEAEKALGERTAFFAKVMGIDYGRITVRNQKTRWGSCSAKGNLNFNWRLILAPGEVLDYVVVHELAHRREMNHSERFWRLVENILPDYQRQRRWLKENGETLMGR